VTLPADTLAAFLRASHHVVPPGTERTEYLISTQRSCDSCRTERHVRWRRLTYRSLSVFAELVSRHLEPLNDEHRHASRFAEPSARFSPTVGPRLAMQPIIRIASMEVAGYRRWLASPATRAERLIDGSDTRNRWA
jgi:hypothetical protein